MNVSQLKAILPRAGLEWLIQLAAEMPRFSIFGPARESAFLGQLAHESAGMTVFDESLYYANPSRVRELFARYFDPLDVDDAWGYLQQPERFANRVYANREGNGDEASGDGWRYRGGGPIQLTFRNNYRRYGDAISYPLEQNPEHVRIPTIGCRVACAYWKANGLNELADRGDHKTITARINKALAGLEERVHYAAKALEVLAA